MATTYKVTAQVNRWGERIYESVPNGVVEAVVRDLVNKGFEVRQRPVPNSRDLTRIEARPKPSQHGPASIEPA